MPNPDQILTVAQMRAAEQALIDAGETVDSLMRAAGCGGAEYIWRIAGHRAVTVLCGPGNNGGDGYVIAEHLRSRGDDVTVVALSDPATSAARDARAAFAGPVLPGDARPKGDVLVDCLFGSGLSRPLEPAAIALLGDLAASHDRLIAIDMPSGVDSDAGLPLNSDLPRCDVTLALGAWKYAHWLMPSAAMMGERRLVPIGVDAVDGAGQLMGRPALAVPALDAHKYTRGLVLVVAGEMPGATLLASKAAMAGGAGYVKLATAAVLPQCPADLVTVAYPLDQVLDDARIGAVLIGPGMGRSEAMAERLRAVLRWRGPLVLDADALMLLEPQMLAGRSGIVIATPHEGELARLAKLYGVAGECKLQTSKALAAASDMVIVAKGPDTVIAVPDGRIVVAPPATSWLSVAGTGDVLAGLIVSRLSAGTDPLTAVCEAVWLHGESARRAAPAFSAEGLIAHISASYASCL